MMSQALGHKEALIVQMEQELAIEQTRRDQMNKNFDT